MATTSPSILQPEQQEPSTGETLTNYPQAVPTTSGVSGTSGSIGPFFAVISVLTVLAILSCYLGRICSRKAVTPLDSIKDRGCLGWVKRIRCRPPCVGGDVEVGPSVMALGEAKSDARVKDGEAHQQQPA
ncbi:putative Transmembrane protein [Quillaja saponaria]|uniref:Transmembrane protein n=1 Tax=Quillaja saponaria TaxID=32244 RepID=A0AAD7LEA7_QUISA|nr:putative Transmembrane protein [Quillaja saponaria]